MDIKFKLGSVIEPSEQGNIMIAHGCNDLGFGGAGVIVPIKRKWPEAYDNYTRWFERGCYKPYYCPAQKQGLAKLGEIQVTHYDNIGICYAITQSGIGLDRFGQIPFRYEAFAECLNKINEYMDLYDYDVLCIPRIGCGLAGASWDRVEQIIYSCMEKQVVVYDLPSEKRDGVKYD